MGSDFYSMTVTAANGTPQSLAQYQGKVVLVVNVASQCGFTPQYEGLQKLYEQFQQQGFVILGFPCNQFGAQEPGSDEQIQSFCQLNLGVKFPVFAKIDVNGPNASPVYSWLKKSAPGILGTEGIKWNFTKFLLDRNGAVIKRFAPNTKPEDIADAIREIL